MANEIYKPTQKEIRETLEKHMHWLREDCEGCEDMRADLSYADLSYADLSYADLRSADLSYADLSSADLRSANLRSADLSYANLSYANLSYADLSYADLSYADLSYANLSYANLSYADLSYADLSYAKNLNYPTACPSDGAFVGWKKARTENGLAIVKLEITENAKRSSSTGRKCRCDKAKILAVYDMNGKEIEKAHSNYDKDFLYVSGEIITSDSFDDDRWKECSNGIHFFITRQEAEEYSL